MLDIQLHLESVNKFNRIFERIHDSVADCAEKLKASFDPIIAAAEEFDQLASVGPFARPPSQLCLHSGRGEVEARISEKPPGDVAKNRPPIGFKIPKGRSD